MRQSPAKLENQISTRSLMIGVSSLSLIGMLALSGCATATGSSRVDSGAAHHPISTADVNIYISPPSNYTKIGTVTAESESDYHGGPLSHASAELINQAAKVGANALISVEAVRTHYTDTQPAIYDDRFRGDHKYTDPRRIASFTTHTKHIRLSAIVAIVPAESAVPESAIIIRKIPALNSDAWSREGENGPMKLEPVSSPTPPAKTSSSD